MKLFRPKRVVPNTLDPRLGGLDWVYINRVFASYLHPLHRSPRAQPSVSDLIPAAGNTLSEELLNDPEDVTLKNLVGDGAISIANRWVDGNKLLKKISIIRAHLKDQENDLVDKLLKRVGPPQQQTPPAAAPSRSSWLQQMDLVQQLSSPSRIQDSEDESDGEDSEIERGRTAHMLFASDPSNKEQSLWLVSPGSTTNQDSPTSEDVNKKKEQVGLIEETPMGINRLTPVSSPIRVRNLNLSASNFQTTSRGVSSPFSGNIDIQTSHFLNTAHATKRQIYSLASPISLMSSPTIDVASKLAYQPSRKIFPETDPASRSGSLKSVKKSFTVSDILDPLPDVTKSRHYLQRQHTSPTLTKRPAMKRPTKDAEIRPSKRPRLHQVEDVALSKSVQEETHSKLSPPPWVVTEREYWHRTRMDMATKLATALPDLVASNFSKKQMRQRGQLARKEKSRMLGNEDDPSTSCKLASRPTIPSPETVYDENAELIDWDRSRRLAEAIRRDLADGKKPSLPLLQCAQSQSQSP